MSDDVDGRVGEAGICQCRDNEVGLIVVLQRLVRVPAVGAAIAAEIRCQKTACREFFYGLAPLRAGTAAGMEKQQRCAIAIVTIVNRRISISKLGHRPIFRLSSFLRMLDDRRGVGKRESMWEYGESRDRRIGR